MSGTDPASPVEPAPPEGPAADGDADSGDYLDAALSAAFGPRARPRESGDGGESATSPPPGIGGRYAIQGEIARGGMGIVYEVKDRDFGRQLAMKMLRPHAAAEKGGPGGEPVRFLEEARITAQLGHPGIVLVHDLGFDEEGRPYFTMDRVKGRTLGEVLEGMGASEDGASLSRVLGILVKVCQAVAFAHSKSVVHRDLKPANVMVGKYGEVYVMDWGLAKIIGAAAPADRPERGATAGATDSRAGDSLIIVQSPDASPPTLAGSVIGTPAYMAPEQARGATAEVDHLSDIYALGAILYQVLAGLPPYLEEGHGKSSREVLARVLAGPPRPILKLQPRAPVELVAVCNKAMSREKAGRYASCLEVAEELQAYLDNRVVQAHRTGALAEARAWVRRNRGTAIITATALCLIAGAVAAFLFAQSRHNEMLSRQVYAYDLSRAVAAFGARNTEILRSSLEGCPVEYRGWEWRRLHHLASIVRHAYQGNQPGSPLRCIAAHPNGIEFASGGDDDTVRIWKLGDAAGGRTLWKHTADIHALAYGRRGAVLAAAAVDGWVKIFDTASGSARMSVREASPAVSLAMHPDGERLVIGTLGGEINARRVASGEPLRSFPGDAGRVPAVAIDPDGKWVAVASDHSGVRVWDFETGALSRELRMPATALAFEAQRGATCLWMGTPSSLCCLDLASGKLDEPFKLNKGRVHTLSASSDGSRLVSVDNSVRLVDTRSREGTLALVHELAHVFIAAAITPDGRSLIAGTQAGELYSWDLSETLGQRVLLEPEARGKWAVAIHPNRTLIAAARTDGKAILWDAEAGRVLRTLAGHTQGIRSLCFDPSGERLATASFDATVKVWEVGTGRELTSFTGHTGVVSDAAFGPGGRVVASASYDNTVKVWEADTGRVLHTLSGHKDAVWWVDFSPDGRWIASGSVDSTLAIWDAATGAKLRTLSGHTAPVDGVEFSPDGATLASSSFDGTLKLWTPANGECLHTLRGHSGFIASFAFTPDGSRILSVAGEGQLKVWEVETGRELVSLPCARDTIDIATAGETVATVTRSGAVILWETDAGKPAPGPAGEAPAGR